MRELKTVRFTRPAYLFGKYECSEQGDLSGGYVRAGQVQELVAKAISTIRGLADQQAMPDEHYMETLTELESTLTKITKGSAT
jgi:hypothetical protein